MATLPKVQPKRCPTCGHVLGFERKPLTKIQAEILKFVGDAIAAEGCAPTFREIADRFGWKSEGSVATHIEQLEAKGYIRREPRSARGITLLVRFDEIGSLPVETTHG